MPSQSTLWGPVQATSLPGVHFLGTELENLRSVSQAGSVVSSSSRQRTTVEDPEPVTPNASIILRQRLDGVQVSSQMQVFLQQVCLKLND